MVDFTSAPEGQTIKNSDWRKSTWSLGDGECVELAVIKAQVAVRDTKGVSKDVLHFRAASWHNFLKDLRSSLRPLST
jgi:hypothetical protein